MTIPSLLCCGYLGLLKASLGDRESYHEATCASDVHEVIRKSQSALLQTKYVARSVNVQARARIKPGIQKATTSPQDAAWSTCKISFPNAKRIALLFTGEAFRDTGNQLQRGMCGNDTIDAQRSASASHVQNLVEPLKALGYEINIFGSTYPCANNLFDMSTSLLEFYGAYMTKLSLITRADQEFGGQIKSYQAAMANAVASGEYDYYFVLRWDLAVEAPVDLSCALDGQGIARHMGMLHGMDTKASWGHFNMDWILIIPGQLSKCFSMMLDSSPESCCSSQCLGPGCAICADNLNDRVAPDINPVVQSQGSCPAQPVRFSRAKPPANEASPYPTCQCCRKNHVTSPQQGTSLKFVALQYDHLLDDAMCRCS